MANKLSQDTLSIDMGEEIKPSNETPKHDWVIDKMEWWAALVEWESGGLEDIPTENLIEFKDELTKEIEKRSS